MSSPSSADNAYAAKMEEINIFKSSTPFDFLTPEPVDLSVDNEWSQLSPVEVGRRLVWLTNELASQHARAKRIHPADDLKEMVELLSYGVVRGPWIPSRRR